MKFTIEIAVEHCEPPDIQNTYLISASEKFIRVPPRNDIENESLLITLLKKFDRIT